MFALSEEIPAPARKSTSKHSVVLSYLGSASFYSLVNPTLEKVTSVRLVGVYVPPTALVGEYLLTVQSSELSAKLSSKSMVNGIETAVIGHQPVNQYGITPIDNAVLALSIPSTLNVIDIRIYGSDGTPLTVGVGDVVYVVFEIERVVPSY